MQWRAQAGLAWISPAQNDLAHAFHYIEDMLPLLGNARWCGLAEPFQVYLTCYQVLQANQDPRAQSILSTAYHLLQERAARIKEEWLGDFQKIIYPPCWSFCLSSALWKKLHSLAMRLFPRLECTQKSGAIRVNYFLPIALRHSYLENVTVHQEIIKKFLQS